MSKFRLWASGAAVADAPERAVSFRPHRGTAAAAAGMSAGEAQQLLRTFEESNQGLLWAADADGRLTYISETMTRTLEDPTALVGRPVAEVFMLADVDLSARRTLSFLLAKQSPFERVNVRSAIAADERWWSLSGSPQHDAAGRFVGFRGSAIDVTEHRRSSEHASQMAQYDPLTGLPNRRRMAEVLDASLIAAQQYRRSCAVLTIDLDRFKQVNDTLGHPAGDALLKQVAMRLGRIVGDVERVFRLGGDEFQVIVPNLEDRGAIGDLAANIIEQLSQPYSVQGSRCIVGASVGIARAPVDGATRSDLIRNADLALYASKSGGRGCFRFFSADLLEVAETKRTLEEDLRDALARGEMHLAYQPIVSTGSNHVVGVEALIRWTHPSRGPISPAQFISIAEEAGVIEALGEWALHQACADAASWPGKLRVAVNVSPLQFSSERLPATVSAALAASGLPPERLELEITEGVFLSQSAATDAMFASLKGLGVRLALDDFGTGYSSLGYLRTAPFDKIKIDQTFVRAATMPESRDSAIISAIVALAEALDMETTAEGIEFMEQLDLIRGLRVSHVQGWVYSKAIRSDELVERLGAGEWTIEPFGPERQRSARQSTYRKVGVIHANRYRSVILRNISESGALIDAEDLIPVGELIMVDLGDGQLSWARVTRLLPRQFGIAFEQELIADGSGGFRTAHRVSSYDLKSLGLPSPGDPDRVLGGATVPAIEELGAKLGLPIAAPKPSPAARRGVELVSTEDEDETVPTVADIAGRYLKVMVGDAATRAAVQRDITRHIAPRFGELRLDEVSEADVAGWLASKSEHAGEAPGTYERLRSLLSQIWTMAAALNVPGVNFNPAEGSLRIDRRGSGGALLDGTAAERLLDAARLSQNRQLRFILAVLMLTGARPGEVLNARWADLDLANGVWRVGGTQPDTARELRLNSAAVDLLHYLSREPGSPWVIPNPATRKPYRSLLASWEAVRSRADLAYLEIDDLRYCDLGVPVWEESLLGLVLATEVPRSHDGPAEPPRFDQAA